MTKVSEFSEWLGNELSARGWTQAELARKTGMTSGAINHLVLGNRNPGPEFLTSLARVFQLPPDELFRVAGLLPEKPEEPPNLAEWVHLFITSSEAEREEMLEFARFKRRKRNETVDSTGGMGA